MNVNSKIKKYIPIKKLSAVNFENPSRYEVTTFTIKYEQITNTQFNKICNIGNKWLLSLHGNDWHH